MFFLVGILPLYWSVAMGRMSGLMAAAGLAFINTVGLLGGFVGPYLYGYAEEATGSTAAGFLVMLAFSVLGVLLVPLLRRTVRAEDAAARRGAGAQIDRQHSAANRQWRPRCTGRRLFATATLAVRRGIAHGASTGDHRISGHQDHRPRRSPDDARPDRGR